MPEWGVPGYTELKRIGSGGFGEVVLARHDESGTLVAIKYLRHDLLADQAFAEMFRSEAEVLAALDDPNVVRLYEYVESRSGAAIVMELVGGVSLREILTFQGKTTAEAALVVLQGSLLGLAAAHRRGVVHRDYKPENVLVNGDGMSKLTDFGIAARAGDHPVPAGTLLYAAPEQMAGAPASPAGDIYAATVTFYECLTGRPPFSGETTEMLLRQHRSEPVPLEPVPEPLRPLVAAGLAKDPRSRPTDATTFVSELSTAASGAYGRHWHDHGRSHLAEAALLLAALWPSGPPPSAQGTAVHRVRLRRHLGRHVSAVKAAIAAGVVIAAAATGTALAATGSPRPVAANHPVAAVQQVSLQASPAQASPAGTSASASTAQTSPSTAQTSPSPSPSPSAPPASVCQPDGTGCTKAGTYLGPHALINGDYGGFKLVWTESVVQPYSSGVPLYWTAYVTYTNIGSSTLSLSCQGNVTDLSSVQEYMSGGDGDDGSVPADSTPCSQNPSWIAHVPPGGTAEVYATFHNVPWPGSAVAIQWGGAGRSGYVYPFN
jgi:tRNA A-37 threonylcarbamoyl transferase component Bud32